MMFTDQRGCETRMMHTCASVTLQTAWTQQPSCRQCAWTQQPCFGTFKPRAGTDQIALQSFSRYLVASWHPCALFFAIEILLHWGLSNIGTPAKILALQHTIVPAASMTHPFVEPLDAVTDAFCDPSEKACQVLHAARGGCGHDYDALTCLAHCSDRTASRQPCPGSDKGCDVWLFWKCLRHV